MSLHAHKCEKKNTACDGKGGRHERGGDGKGGEDSYTG